MNLLSVSQKEKEDHICPIGKEPSLYYPCNKEKDNSKKRDKEVSNRTILEGTFFWKLVTH